MKFTEWNSEIFDTQLITSNNYYSYVIQIGFIVYKTEYKGKEVAVELQNGNYFLNGDYKQPDPEYYIYQVTIDGEETLLLDIEDQYPDLYEAINDLVNDHNYNIETDPDSYHYTVREIGKYGDIGKIVLDNASYDDLTDYLRNGYYIEAK